MRVVGSPTKSGLWTIGLVRSAHASYDRRQSSAASLPPTRSVATLKRCWDSRAPADKPACRSGRPARRARQPFGSHFLYPISRGPPENRGPLAVFCSGACPQSRSSQAIDPNSSPLSHILPELVSCSATNETSSTVSMPPLLSGRSKRTRPCRGTKIAKQPR